jgi:hypothetical protein
MTDAGRWNALKRWAQLELAGCVIENDADRGHAHAFKDVLTAIKTLEAQPDDAQPDPHPLGSVRFDEATPEQFRDFWGTAGFATADQDFSSVWRRQRSTGSGQKVYIYEDGVILWGDNWLNPVSKPMFPTFQEALDALNELAATKIMGGWA